MAVNLNDERFTKVENDKQTALSELEQTYSDMINKSDQYYDTQINASKEWAEAQKQNQQAQTDFAIQQIEQQKEQTQKDYIKEQSGAYTDWRKQSNEYGAEAEKMASAGLANTGYKESSQVSMYNAYQNRVMTARETLSKAILNYDNNIQNAILQNNSALAEIAFQALQQQAELALQGFQYKNQLITEQAARKTELDNIYYSRYLDVYNQIREEQAIAEEIRQYNANLALQKQQLALQQEQLAEERRQYNTTMAYQREKDAAEAEAMHWRMDKDKNNNVSQLTYNGKPINKQSILDVGLAARSADYISNQISAGKVFAYEKNGEIYLTSNPVLAPTWVTQYFGTK